MDLSNPIATVIPSADGRESCRSWAPPARSVWLFGSLARGESPAESDIDVLIVRPVDVDDPDWIEQLTVFADQVRDWTGNACEVLEYGEAELSSLLDAGLDSDLRSHGMTLAGVSPAEMLRSASSGSSPGRSTSRSR